MGAAAIFLGRCIRKGSGMRTGRYGDHDPDDIDISKKAGLDLGHAVDLCASVVDGIGHG